MMDVQGSNFDIFISRFDVIKMGPLMGVFRKFVNGSF